MAEFLNMYNVISSSNHNQVRRGSKTIALVLFFQRNGENTVTKQLTLLLDQCFSIC